MTTPSYCFGLTFVFMARSIGRSGAESSDQNWTDFARSYNEFALDLYKEAAHDESEPYGNLFFSPLSISYALGLLKLGANGSSLEQIDAALRLDSGDDDDEYHDELERLSKLLLHNDDDGSGKSYSFRIANDMFVDRSFDVLQECLAKARRFYGAGLARLDFRNDPRGATDLINRWASNRTGGKIRDLVQPTALNDLTRLALVDAVHFQGRWLHRFDRRLTTEEDFHSGSGGEETVRARFMKSEPLHLNQARVASLDARVLELPFAEDVVFHVVLPDPGASLERVEAALTSRLLQESLELDDSELVSVWLPSFELDLDFELERRLKALGVADVFDEDASDLSRVGGAPELFVSEAVHRARIGLNEEGVEAAASTAAFARSLTSAGEPLACVEFRADRPFVFYLKDARTGMIYFMGRLVRP